MKVNGQLHAPAAFPCGIRWFGDWLGLIAGVPLCTEVKSSFSLPEIEPRFLGRPVCSESLY
jgi:hypothetical protein